MVKDRIADGRRIGQLLASELTGLQRGPLADVSVVDADRDVDPTPDGAFAYRVTADDAEVAVVEVTPATARLLLKQEPGPFRSVMISPSTGQPSSFTAARR